MPTYMSVDDTEIKQLSLGLPLQKKRKRERECGRKIFTTAVVLQA